MLLWASLTIFSPASVVIDDTSTKNSISVLENSNLYIDTDNLSIDEVIEQQVVRPFGKPYINTGMRNLSIWVNFKITNKTIETINKVLVLSSPMLESIILYPGNGLDKPQLSGRENPSDHNDTLSYYFDITLNAQETKEYYLKVKSVYTPVYFSITIRNKESYLREDTSLQVIDALLLGVIVGLMVYNFLIAIRTQDKSYLYYSFYLFALVWHQMSYLGFTQLYLPDGFGLWDMRIPNQKSSFLMIVSALFSMQFLKIHTMPVLRNIYRFFIVATFLNLFVSYIFDIKDMNTISIMSIFYIAFVLVASIISYKNGNKQARLFVLGFFLLFVSYLMLAANALGITSIMESHKNILIWSTAIDALILSLAFADRYVILRQEKELSDKQVLLASMQREEIIQKEVVKKTSQLNKALRTKDLLLQEVHHRVKNNLQIILSMIRLQNDEIDNQDVADKFKSMEQRISAISKTYEMLLVADDIGYIDMEEYLEALLWDIGEAYTKSGVSIHLETDISATLPLKEAVYIGLIVNELVTNAYKHAFGDMKEGKILVWLRQKEDTFTLIVEDNGPGYNQQTNHTLGLRLIHVLIVEQLNGTIDAHTNPPCRHIIRFKI